MAYVIGKASFDGRLLVRFLGSQKLYVGFQLWELAPVTPALFKGQLYTMKTGVDLPDGQLTLCTKGKYSSEFEN